MISLHRLRRRFSALATVLGLGIALPFAVGATPAYAEARLEITKTHNGDFPRGGVGTYRITVSNSGDEPTSDSVRMTDFLPEGLTVAEVRLLQAPPGVQCEFTRFVGTSVTCDGLGPLGPRQGYVVEITVNVADDAPCTITNTARAFTSLDFVAANDPTTIPGPGCDTANGGDGASILPISLSGLLPIYNNTGSNVLSPGATTGSNQTSRVNTAP
ncbi:hypothetical protein ACFVHW_11460 [Streptomyces sp. NPDC127110]|uniref:hypothetical protein n=1 Tax=Streptomyces sp. NPDC127110 TaxID=3345362 RepID=UPI0036347B5D